MRSIIQLIIMTLIMTNVFGQKIDNKNLTSVNKEYVPRYVNILPALDNPSQVYHLAIKNCSGDIGNFKKLTYLYLRSCVVTEDVLNEINKCNRVKELAISRSTINKLFLNSNLEQEIDFMSLGVTQIEDLESVNKTISNLSNLKTLNISLSNIPVFYNNWTHLSNLEEISIGNTSDIFNIDSSFLNISKLKSLRKLNINSSDIENLPESFQELNHMEKVIVFNCKNINVNQIISSVKSWKNLKSLGFAYMNLTTLPEELAGMQSLKILNLMNNQHLDIKQALFVISKIECLEELDISNCIGRPEQTEEYMMGRFDDLAKLKNLKKLNLSNSRSRLPESIYTWSILGQLTNLEELILYRAYIDFIPEDFAKLTKLKQLDISWTHHENIEQIEKFPDSMEVLKMKTCHVKEFPKQVLNSPNLVSVNLQDNDLTEIPEMISIMKNLVHLDLSYNDFETLPESIKELKNNLKYLNLMGTPVGTNPEKLSQVRTWLPNTEVFGGE